MLVSDAIYSRSFYDYTVFNIVLCFFAGAMNIAHKSGA